MTDVNREYVVREQKPPTWLTALAIVGVLLALGGLGWALALQNRLNQTQTQLAAADQRSQSLTDKLEQTNERMRAQGETLGHSVGLTQKQLEDKSNELLAAQHVAAASTARLAKEQAQTSQQVTAVKTDVGGVKTDVASTQADLAATKTQMSSMMGDEGKMSGLIARNHDELEELRHKGDRNYYEFTLNKGQQPQLVGTIRLGLKKVDVKRSKFKFNVNSDDKNIEKKDKNLDEPIQFYSGKTPMLYEIVVNSVNKNQVVGYLSTPKGAPAPMAMP